MTAFIIILAIVGVLILAMNEYGWTDLTGNTRNDLVFEKRNKNYGAYEIRQKYSNRLVIAFFGAIAFISIAAISPKVFLKSDALAVQPGRPGPDHSITEYDNKLKEDKKEEIKENIEKPKTDAAKGADVNTKAELQPKATDKPVVTDTTQNKNAIVSTVTHKGLDSTSTAQVIPGKGGTGNCMDCDTSSNKIEIRKKIHDPGEADQLAYLDNYQSFIRKHLRIPEGARGGKIYMSFVVDAEGNVTQAKVKKGVDPLMDAEVKRVISIMPKWNPAIKEGQPIAVRMILPVNIVIE